MVLPPPRKYITLNIVKPSYIIKLGGVALLMTDPPPTSSTTLKKKKKQIKRGSEGGLGRGEGGWRGLYVKVSSPSLGGFGNKEGGVEVGFCWV